MKIKKETLVTSLVSIVIVLVMLYQVSTAVNPYFSDEIGYWGAGAWYAGIDWSPILSHTSYYGWGYGLILAVFFLIPNGVLRFKVALMFNIFMLLGIYYITYKLLLLIFENKNPNSKTMYSLIAGTATVYTYNIVYANTTMCETFLTLLFLLIIYFFYKFLLNNKMKYFIFLNISLFLQLATHLRTLAIYIALFITFAILTWKRKIRPHYLIIMIIVVVINIGVIFAVKNILISGQYTVDSGNIIRNSGNDSLIARVGVFRYLLTRGFWENLSISILGKLFYLLCASFTFAYWGIKHLWQSSYHLCKKKKTEVESENLIAEQGTNLLLLLSFAGSFGLSCITLMYATRVDHIFYGRYFENTIVLIIAIGMVCVWNRFRFKEVFYLQLIILISSKVLFEYLQSKNLVGALPMECAWIAGIVPSGYTDYVFKFTILTAMISSSAIWIMFILKKYSKYLWTLFVFCTWIYASFNAIENCINIEKDRMNYIIEAADEIKQHDIEYYTFVDTSDIASLVDVLWLQYQCGKKTIGVIDPEDISQLKINQYLLLSKAYPNSKIYAKKQEIIYENPRLYILKGY